MPSLLESPPPRTALDRFAITWEGTQFVHHSLALVNRELCTELLRRGHELSLKPFEPATFSPRTTDRDRALARSVNAELSRPADFHIRHRWPPDFRAPAHGRLVVMQHWEYGSLPKAWIEPLNTVVDETWVATHYVRDCFVRSGVDPERVHVVPCGVDVARFRPQAARLELATSKRFRFLFVGGTIVRKGINILLDAYCSAFTAADDVCLVIKDLGSSSIYKGSTAGDRIREYASRPGAPEILHLDSTLSDHEMPGLYTACDALVHPYLGEGFGLPIAEAMACGLPVIVTGHGAALDFCDEACAWFIPAREFQLPEARIGELATVDKPWLAQPDAAALTRILREVHSDPERARERGWVARERIRSGFTWQHAADACEERLAALAEREPRDSERCPSVQPMCPPVRWGAAPFNYSGYARISRMVLPALADSGVQVELQSYGLDREFAAAMSDRPKETAAWNQLISQRVQTGLYVCFHPPLAWNGEGLFERYRRQNPGLDAYVGMTMFETDRLPPGWADECATMDEVWVPSAFNLETFVAGGVPREKLRLFQPGLDLAPFRAARPSYPIPGKRGFTFLSVFQWSLRKGWDVLLEAYVRAFTKDDDVCLAIRAYPGYRKDPPLRQRIERHLKKLGLRARDCPPILLIDEFLSEERMVDFYAAGDAFVLPSRGEAWGLPYMEAMAAGLPTLGTRWGGQLDFMTDENSYLIDALELEPVGAEQTAENAYYTADQRWARPSVEHTAELMRTVFDRRDEARARGRRARADIFAGWGPERSVRQFATLSADLVARRRAAHARPVRPTHIAWNAPLYDPSGYASEARQFVLGLEECGALVSTIPVQWSERRAELDEAEQRRLDRLRATVQLSNHVLVQHNFASRFQPVPDALATVGRTMFETDRLPAAWVEKCNALDEIWVPSAFNVETFARSGVDRAKLHIVPGALAPRANGDPLTLPERRGTAFLSMFDWGLRKGWDVLLRAYTSAFESADDVVLYLKLTSSAKLSAQELTARVQRFLTEELGRSRKGLPAVVCLSGDWSEERVLRLYRSVDAYVMPSRGEGWGRPYMEAMAAGLPTIGTRFGGNLEYMNDENSYLIDFELTPVPEAACAEAPLFRGHSWAEPSCEHLVELLQRVARDRDDAARRGARAQREVLERYDRRKVAACIHERARALALRNS